MNMKSSAGKLAYPLIVLVMLLSFFTFSENFFPLLNSDMAVNILMTPSFSLPHDIYFWGQDRSGNIIPLIAHMLYVITGWPPVVLVSIVHYLILLAGYWALTRFLHSPYSRLAAALLWFLPPWHFIEFLLILYGLQSSCVMLALNFADRAVKAGSAAKQYSWLLASCLAFIIAAWVSDMAVISIVALCLTGGVYFLLRMWEGIISIRSPRMWISVVLLLAMAAGGYLLLGSFKAASTPVQAYNQGFLAAPAVIIETAGIVLSCIARVLMFSSESLIESVFAWGLLVSVFFLIFSKKSNRKSWPKITENPWFWFFLFEAMMTLAAVLSSGWVALNGVGRRYFTTFFLSSWICFLMWLENLPKNNMRIRLQPVFIAVIIVGSLSGFARFYIPEVKPSRIRVLYALRFMGNAGIIAEYWNSYLAASVDPVRIKATPHDKDYVRNPDLAKDVFKQPKIYLIKDGWLDTFPDTIVQFGHILKKKGSAFHLADAWLNRYEVVKH